MDRLMFRWFVPSKDQFKGWSLPSKITYYSFIIGVISICFTIFIVVSSEEIQRLILESRKRITFTGIWKDDTQSQGPVTEVSMLIDNETMNLFHFEMEASSGRDFCHIYGFAEKLGDTFLLSRSWEAGGMGLCGVVFKYNKHDDTFYVEVRNCSAFCNRLNSTFKAELSRKGDGFLFTHGLLSEVEDINFRKLVADDYAKFTDRMTHSSKKLIKENEKVVIGARGETFGFISPEAIIIVDSGGAILEGDRAFIYNNFIRWEEYPPGPAIDSMSGLADWVRTSKPRCYYGSNTVNRFCDPQVVPEGTPIIKE